MKIPVLLFIISLLALGFACGGGSSTNETGTSAATPPEPPDGAKIYKLNCTLCHGSGGDMGASGAHDLTQSTLSLEERVHVITNGRNTMTPFKRSLSPEQIEAVATYIGTFQKTN